MTTYGSGDAAFLYVDGYQVAGVTTSLEDEQEAATEDNTGLGETLNRSAFVGDKSYTVKHGGFFDDDAASVIEALDPAAGGKLGAEHYLAYAIAGNVAGRPVMLTAGALEAKMKKQVQRGKLTKASVEYLANSAIMTYALVAARASRSTAGNTDTASADNGASSASGGLAVLFVDTLTGSPTNLTVTVRHSADNVTFADHGSGILPVVTPANQRTPQFKALSGTINRYVSLKWAWTGGTAPTWTGALVLRRY